MSSFTTTIASGAQLTCLRGIIRRAEEIGFIQRGTHRLFSASGRLLATLRSNRIDLDDFVGRFVTVCGISEGRIEGVLSIRVTRVFPVFQPGRRELRDDRTLLVFILLNRPELLRGFRRDILLRLIRSGRIRI